MSRQSNYYKEALRIFIREYGDMRVGEMAVKRDLMIVAEIFNKKPIDVASDCLRLRMELNKGERNDSN